MEMRGIARAPMSDEEPYGCRQDLFSLLRILAKRFAKSSLISDIYV